VTAGTRHLRAWAQRITDGRRGRGEAGASLILALAMITIVSVSLLAVLGFATTSFRAVTTVQEQRSAAYAADGAVQTAIAVVQKDATACPGSVAYGTVGGQSVTADCTVKSQGTAVTGSMPSSAVWTGSGGAAFTTSGTTSPGGPVVSNGTISAGTLAVGAYTVQASGACTGTITTDDAADAVCNTGQAYTDPGYPSETIGALGAANPAPTCAVTNGVLQFSPGYYTNTAVFQTPTYTQSGKTCLTNYLSFKPGVYYFDFGVDPLYTDTQWDVAASQVVVGGEVKGWDPNVANSKPGVPGSTVDGTSVACKTEKDGATTGVQFVFGGLSEMSVKATASVELCADPTPATTSQQIAIYGQTTSVAPEQQTLTRSPTTATPSPANGWTGLTPVNKVLPIAPATVSIDGQAATYTLPSASPASTTSMTLGGYAAAAPTGSNLSYDLQIQHAESVPGNVGSVTVKVGTCSPFTVTPLSTALATLHLNSSTLNATNYNCLRTAVASNFTVLYTATAAKSKSFVASLDGIDLVATYTPPTVRAQSGCVLTDVTNCSMLALGAGAKFVVWGTVYAPLASISAEYTSGTSFEFRRGVLLRALRTSGTPPADTTANFCLGYGKPCYGPSRVVLFSGKVAGSEKAKALVQYVDTPAVGSKVQVLSWNVVR